MRNIGRTATYIKTTDGLVTGMKVTSVIYHETEVVRFTAETIELNSGGWRTVTTKRRMNQASNQFGLGYSVYQHAGEWFVSFKGKEIEFKDHITLTR